jgi:uridine phosphorylase
MSTQPHLQIADGDPNSIALLPGDPGRVERIADRCDDATRLADHREYRVVNGRYEGVPLTVCSTGIGSPSAAIAVEELAGCGVETFLRVGTCGALQPGLREGDAVIATAAAKDEGTTARYESPSVPAVAHHRVVHALTAAVGASDIYRDVTAEPSAVVGAEGAPGRERAADDPPLAVAGPVTTDDAFYAETGHYVTDWNEANLLAVEMEAAAILTLARRHSGRAGAICTVDGNLVAGTKKGAGDGAVGELPAAADDGVSRAIDVALDAVTRL